MDTPRFVGQDPERGHLLRRGALVGATVDERIDTEVLIVGGGASGFAAAWHLRRRGVTDLHLVELEDATGGTARGGELERSPHPLGAHYLPEPPAACIELQELLGDLELVVGHEADGRPEYLPSLICPAPLERHFFEGQWHPGLYPFAGQSAEDERQWIRWSDHLRELERRGVGADGRPLFTLPVERSSTELRHLDRISIGAHLDALGIDSWRVRWMVEYACRDDYGCTLETTSAFAALHHFLARGLEETTERATLAFPEGNDGLVKRMRDRAALADRLHLGAAAYEVDPGQADAGGEVRVHEVASGRNVAFRARAILWAAPRFILPHVLVDDRPDPLPRGAITYAPWLVANLQLSEWPGGFGAPTSWDNVPIGADDLGYVVANHAEPMTVREPGAVITYYEPFTGRDPAAERARLLQGDATTWLAHVRKALERVHPAIGPKIRASSIARWGHAMVRPVPGLLFGDALRGARAPLGAVIPCATDTRGLALFEEAFYAGRDAAELALARLGRA